MKKIDLVCVVGAGTIGSLFIGHLGSIVETTVLTRRKNHANAINKEGLSVIGKSLLHTKVFASTDPAELGDVKLVILATKTLAVEASTKRLAGYFPNAHILMMQNGLGCEEIVKKYGDWPIISGVTLMSGTRLSDICVEYELDATTCIGPWEGSNTSYEFVKQVEALFNRSGLKVKAYNDILPHQWSKLIFNSVLNSISAITDLPHVNAFIKREKLEDLGHLVFNMMDEGKRIAEARGVKLAEDPWEMNFMALNQGTTKDGKYAHISSMLDDIRNKRITEVDWITGAIVREAEKAGIPAPYHKILYQLIKGLESSWSMQ